MSCQDHNQPHHYLSLPLNDWGHLISPGQLRSSASLQERQKAQFIRKALGGRTSTTTVEPISHSGRVQLWHVPMCLLLAARGPCISRLQGGYSAGGVNVDDHVKLRGELGLKVVALRTNTPDGEGHVELYRISNYGQKQKLSKAIDLGEGGGKSTTNCSFA